MLMARATASGHGLAGKEHDGRRLGYPVQGTFRRPESDATRLILGVSPYTFNKRMLPNVLHGERTPSRTTWAVSQDHAH
jgi:hypothetical protein